MQTGIFYVRLRRDVDPKEGRVQVGDREVFIGEVLTKDRPYPVLAVEYLQGPEGAKTLYHLPVDDNTIAWLPAELFVFARD